MVKVKKGIIACDICGGKEKVVSIVLKKQGKIEGVSICLACVKRQPTFSKKEVSVMKKLFSFYEDGYC